MSDEIISVLVIASLSLFVIAMGIVIFILKQNYNKNRVYRAVMDKKPSENHKLSLRPPTWRFQKYHPTRCLHETGIYRKLRIKLPDGTSIVKKIFICSDCVYAVEIDEIYEFDNIKKSSSIETK